MHNSKTNVSDEEGRRGNGHGPSMCHGVKTITSVFSGSEEGCVVLHPL